MVLFLRLCGLLGLLVLAQLTSCATSADVATTLSLPVDSAVQQAAAQQQLAHQVRVGKVKFTGPVTIQVGTGNVNAPKARAPVAAGASQAQDYTGAGRHGGALAAAPGASAKAITRTGVPPWVLAAGGVGLVLLALLGLMYKLRG